MIHQRGELDHHVETNCKANVIGMLLSWEGNPMRRYFAVMLLSVVMLTGCVKDSIRSLPPSVEGDHPLELLIDWEYIDMLEESGQLKTAATVDVSSLPPANHVGVRLVIPDSKGAPDGVYAKSLRRQSDKESVQYEVQPTNNAYLQIVITHTPEVWGTGPHYLYYVGVIRNLVSRANGLESYTLEDAELYNPTDQWELVPPWNTMQQEGEIILAGDKEYSFRWRWKKGSPMPVRGQDPQMVEIIGNFGRQMEDDGWYDYGSSSRGHTFKAPGSGEWTVGFLIWINGERYGLGTQSYYLPSTVRDGDSSNTRWTIMFKEQP